MPRVEPVARERTKGEDAAYQYLAHLFAICAPQCEPLPDLMGLCTQIDNLIVGYRIKLGELA